MTPEEARTALAAAVHEREATKASWDMAREHLYEVIREASAVLRQNEIANAAGYTRERIRVLTLDRERQEMAKTG